MKTKSHYIFLLILSLLSSGAASQPGATERIRLNQLGFYPNGPKIAIIASDVERDFSVLRVNSKDVVFKSQSKKPVQSPLSGKMYSAADFSALTIPGKYVISVSGIGDSYAFEIRERVHADLATAAIKNFYFQRMSIALDEKYAGKWKRAAGHPDDKVLVHGSAASTLRPAGTLLKCPKGWYDAGDYNKYIVNSGITMGTMLSAYEDFPEFFDQLKVNIPESENKIPDLLDELLWNLRWMLTMQDPADGGVYHKLTNAQFDAMVMPDKTVAPRYVVQKSTAAALDFAAVTAQASRVFRKFEGQIPGLADSCIHASRLAFTWALKYPGVMYRQGDLNKQFDPDIATGEYGDRSLVDEFSWASCELYATTNEDEFLQQIKTNRDTSVSVPGWNSVRFCGYYTLIRHRDKLDKSIVQEVTASVLRLADRLVSGKVGNPYECVMGKTARDFEWGSSAVAANQGIVLLNAFRLTQKKIYLENALHNLDYLLGRNGTGYSFVTGFGDKTPMHPHHRPSEADGIADPIPGMLSGGPNPGMQDKCKYGSSFPDEAFTDDVCSYASNEIAINWNAPLVYLSGAIEALQYDPGFSAPVKK